MDEASQQFVSPQLSKRKSYEPIGLPRIAIHLAVPVGTTITWRARADSEVRVCESRIWLTRVGSPYDYWMQPGDILRLKHGERIWISADGDMPTEVSITTEYAVRRDIVYRWIVRLKVLIFGASAIRTE
ncbi:DUF2917 domain-containing protein [Paraburkholderia sp. HP33-1]|uniref:DUF2917 domain-containing protein n=1 Tax=Paraburkholderia sp. HP33-1 TaxID=2883243 RepID=UPI001F19159D|nr:DUF2917 domain-containing protein [Paraburkholderia sp. HP33-1]